MIDLSHEIFLSLCSYLQQKRSKKLNQKKERKNLWLTSVTRSSFLYATTCNKREEEEKNVIDPSHKIFLLYASAYNKREIWRKKLDDLSHKIFLCTLLATIRAYLAFILLQKALDLMFVCVSILSWKCWFNLCLNSVQPENEIIKGQQIICSLSSGRLCH